VKLGGISSQRKLYFRATFLKQFFLHFHLKKQFQRLIGIFMLNSGVMDVGIYDFQCEFCNRYYASFDLAIVLATF
jgi:hypothetical protein